MKSALVGSAIWRRFGFLFGFALIGWCLAILGPPTLHAQTSLAGAINNAQTWPTNVVLTGDVTIETNGVVTILPGTLIRAAAKSDSQAGGSATDRTELIVNGGKLLIVGTSNAPVVLTSDAAQKAPGDWFGVRFRFGTMTLKFANVEYARTGVRLEGGGELSINDSTFRHSSEDGVHVLPAGVYELNNSAFLNNGRHGLYAPDGGSRLTLTNSVASTNGSNGLNLAGNSTLIDLVAAHNGSSGISGGTMTLTRVRAENNAVDGVNPHPGALVRITGGSFSRNIQAGIRYNCCSSDLVVQDALIERNGGTGLSGFGGPGSQIVNCTIQFNNSNGITWGDNLTVSGSVMANNSATGLQAGSNVIIQNSTLSNNRTGVDVNQGSLTGSTLVGNADFGLYLRGPNPSVLPVGITGNLFRANGSGIRVDSSNASVAFSGNDFVDNGFAVENRGKAAAAANGNYWGETITAELRSGAVNLSRFYDTRDDRTVGSVLIADFLTASITDPSRQTETYTRPPLPGATRTVSGAISGAQTWSGTVFLTGDVTIPQGVTLTVLPGTRVLSDWVDNQIGGVNSSRTELIVDGGRLTVVGSSTARVVFGSAATNALRGDWYGIRFRFGAMLLTHATIEHGQRGLSLEGGGEISISHCTFRQSSEDGARVLAAGLYELNNCAFLNNGQHGLYAPDGGSRLTLTNSVASTNGSNGLELAGNSTLIDFVATHNAGTGINGGNSTLTRVRAENNVAHGVSLGSLARIAGGSFSRNGQNGIRVGCCSPDIVLQDALIERNGGTGVTSGWSGPPSQILNCTIQFNNGNGVAWGDNLTVSRCVIVNNSATGLQAGSVVIQNSTFSNNRTGVHVSQVSLTGSALVGNADYGLYLTSSSQPVLSGGITNNLFRANGSGIRLELGAASISFSGNDFVDNGFAVENRGSQGAVANGNYWGSQTTAELQNNVVNLTRIFDQHDDSRFGLVTITNYLAAPQNASAAIVTQPEAVVTAAGGSAVTLSVVAGGREPITYQWQLNGLDLADDGRIQGAHSSQLVIDPAQDTDSGVLFVTVLNSFGHAVSNPVILTVTPAPPQITQQPASVSVIAGGAAAFGVTAIGAEPLTYQWRKDGVNIAGATSATYAIASAQTSHAGTYVVVVSNPVGSVTSSSVTLSVSSGAPTETHHKADYRDPCFVIDGSEVSRVLSYWRSGGYRVDSAGLDGYAAGADSTDGARHTADYRNPPWVIDGSEASRVLSYWRAGGYHADPAGLDGYAAGPKIVVQGLRGPREPRESRLSLRHHAPVTYPANGRIDVQVELIYGEVPLGLLLRPELPSGWELISAQGDGDPEWNRGELLWTGAIPPSPVRVTYSVALPAAPAEIAEISHAVEWIPRSRRAHPVEATARLKFGPAGSGLAQLTDLMRLSDGRVRVRLRGENGRRYLVQNSEDLLRWRPVGEVTVLEETAEIEDGGNGGAAAGFYRAVVIP